MKFRLLLWVMGLLMARASRKDPAFQQQLKDKQLTFQLQTLDGRIARHFIVENLRLRSRAGLAEAPAFAIAFADAATGYGAFTAKNKQLAFMQGIQDKSIQVKGNPALVMWFQGLAKQLAKRN